MPHDEKSPSVNASGPSLYEEDYQEQFPLEGVLPVGSTLRTSDGLCLFYRDVSDCFLSQSHEVMQGSYASEASKPMGASLDAGSPVPEDISEVQM